MTAYFLTIRDEQLVALVTNPEATEPVRTVPLLDMPAVARICKEAEEQADGVLCSSSLDFPEEYTHDGAVINLCRMIRLAGVEI